VGEGKSIAYPYPTYMLYETLTHAQAGRLQVCYFPRDFALPRQLFGSKARLVLLATPNSPSGTLFPAPLLQELARSLKRGVLVIDEAYSEFASENALALAREEPNVAVLRTLSKSHSLAGMRLGLLFGPKELVAGLWKVKDSYNLDRLAIVAGAAALGDAAWTAANTARIRATRERTARELAALDLEVLPSQSNFLFARLGDSAAARGAYQFLKARNVLVRYFPLRLLDDGVRISIGSDEQMDELLRLLKKYLADGSRRR
jgi:histidinol-phosphate aminotransferase